ncbi:NTE family protein [Paraperlucidibaca baekdonensis]|uniref:NTE family protein n=1 Tax=Paraperlucidibaca baekdonensis TaxID=748120 RepID=A0A3E0HAF2_9GAMM|nr:patatin-like phospholipase family protein [Paraperlucidibaca baekdonensis]REH40202.1 NTE family protein [Paraperlucidibaca baekdonensis]
MSHTDYIASLKQVAVFAALPEAALEALAKMAKAQRLVSGERLYGAGDPPRFLHVLVHGRLQVRHDARILGYVNRYELLGEMGVVAAEPRNSAVYALRDCLLLNLPASAFMALMREHPDTLVAISRLIISRGRDALHARVQQANAGGGTLAVVPAIRDIPTLLLAEALTGHMNGWPDTRLVSAAHIDSVFGDGFSQTPQDGSDADATLCAWLASLEQQHRFIMYVADNGTDVWSLRCLRQADRILLVAESGQQPQATPVLERLREGGLVAPVELVLLRPMGDAAPHTIDWLKATGARAHYFLHPWAKPEIAALARQISGRGIGLVLGGGGARGFAHIGLIKALEQLGIPVDVVGGTSMGAFVAALLACGFDSTEMIHIAHETFVAKNYLNDYTLPKVSLIRGERFHQRLNAIFGERRIEELRRSYYCISTNLTTGMAGVHDRGPLGSWVGTSMCVPGVAPPIAFEGDLLCDGGVVNNLPTDVMAQLERGVIIACNVAGIGDMAAPGAGLDAPDQGALLDWQSDGEPPSLTEILMRTATLTSDTITLQASIDRADTYLRMPIDDIGMFEWLRMDELVQRGYEHGLEVLTPLRDKLLS